MKKAKRRTKAQMYPLVKAWLSSGQSKFNFCERQQVNLATFTYWVQKYQEESQRAGDNGFIKVEEPLPTLVCSPYTIYYPNGVELQIHSRLSLDELSQLIRLVSP